MPGMRTVSMRQGIEGMLVIAIVLDVTYWSIWFTNRDWIASEESQAYYDFVNAFPLADFWLGLACLLALITLRARRPSALLWLLCSGSAALYLFCMDFLYDLEHDIFNEGGEGAFEAVIVALTLTFAITVLSWTWRHRGELLSGDGSHVG